MSLVQMDNTYTWMSRGGWKLVSMVRMDQWLISPILVDGRFLAVMTWDPNLQPALPTGHPSTLVFQTISVRIAANELPIIIPPVARFF